MRAPQDDLGTNPSAAGPGATDGGEPAGEVSSSAPPSSAPPAEDAVEHDLEALLKERDDYLDLAKRTKADFENYRKRIAADLQASVARGRGELARDVIPVLDDLERALEAAGLDPEGDSDDGLAHGVLLVFRSLREALQRNGIEAVDPKGEKFDPQSHEALSTQPVEGLDSGVVVETLQKGYRLDEQLIRPARVVVAE
ncbi:MAG TPA: nucleotide exchange factor GrpE [Solirubrobacterales bacterium]